MQLTRPARSRGEGVVSMLVILLLICGGILWWLYSSRQSAEKGARAFAAEVADRLAVNYDKKFLNTRLSLSGRSTYLQSWTDRVVDRLHELGVPARPIEMEGDVAFNSYFFDPHGDFHAQLKYPMTSAELELGISRGMVAWQIDTINVVWEPSPSPTPEPTLEAIPSPSPGPEEVKR